MVHPKDYRKREIDTPMGSVEITEKKWGKGEDEHWAVAQSLTTDFPLHRSNFDVSNGEVAGHFLEQYAVALWLSRNGYEVYEQMDEKNLLWCNYEAEDLNS